MAKLQEVREEPRLQAIDLYFVDSSCKGKTESGAAWLNYDRPWLSGSPAPSPQSQSAAPATQAPGSTRQQDTSHCELRLNRSRWLNPYEGESGAQDIYNRPEAESPACSLLEAGATEGGRRVPMAPGGAGGRGRVATFLWVGLGSQ